MGFLPGSVTITLRHPFEAEGTLLTELVLRRPKVRDQLVAYRHSGTDFEQELVLFAHLTEQAPSTMEQLDLLDYKQLQDAYTDFLSSGPPIS